MKELMLILPVLIFSLPKAVVANMEVPRKESRQEFRNNNKEEILLPKESKNLDKKEVLLSEKDKSRKDKFAKGYFDFEIIKRSFPLGSSLLNTDCEESLQKFLRTKKANHPRGGLLYIVVFPDKEISAEHWEDASADEQKLVEQRMSVMRKVVEKAWGKKHPQSVVEVDMSTRPFPKLYYAEEDIPRVDADFKRAFLKGDPFVKELDRFGWYLREDKNKKSMVYLIWKASENDSVDSYKAHTIALEKIVKKALNRSDNVKKGFVERDLFCKEMEVFISQMEQELINLSRKTCAKEKNIKPLRSQLKRIKSLVERMSQVKFLDDYEKEHLAVNILLHDFVEGIHHMTLAIETEAFSELDQHVLTLKFGDGIDRLSLVKIGRLHEFFKQEKQLEFISEKDLPGLIKEEKPLVRMGRITLFYWAPDEKQKALCQERAQAIEFFIKSFTKIKDFKVINLEGQANFFQRIGLADQESYLIREAYRGDLFNDTREGVLGPFLAKIGALNHIVLFYE